MLLETRTMPPARLSEEIKIDDLFVELHKAIERADRATTHRLAAELLQLSNTAGGRS